VKVGDLVKVIVKELRTPIGSFALIERVEDREDSQGIVTQYWARMMKSGELFWFRQEWIEAINDPR
jgi:hypothetical protein